MSSIHRWILAGVFAALVAASPHVARAGDITYCPTFEFILYCGELNGDCKITSTDALIALKMAVEQIEPREEADFDRSGTIVASNALRILRIAVGSLPASLDCGSQYALTATNVGFYTDQGVRVSGGYAVGWYVGSENQELRNYLVFDLSGVPGTIQSGVLRLYAGLPVYSSPNVTETYQLFDIDTSIASLVAGTGGVPAFNDLADGNVYGLLVGHSQLRSTVTFQLNPAGVGYLDGSTGQVVLGGAITTLTKGASYEYMFNSTHVPGARQLIVKVD